MRWDRQTMTALGGIAAFLIGGAMLVEDARPLFVPVIGMVGGIAALALANHERLQAENGRAGAVIGAAGSPTGYAEADCTFDSGAASLDNDRP
jgi:hypothetical protein